MTDRYSGFAVVLERDIREDDAQAIIDAIKMIRGVAAVEPAIASPLADIIATSRENTRWASAMGAAVRDTYQNKGNDRG